MATSVSTDINGRFVEGDYWWKVDIGERIIFTYATIYVRDGNCGNPIFNCCKYCYCYGLLDLRVLTCL